MNIEEETPSFVNMTVESTDDKTVNVKLCVVQKGSNPKDTLEGVIGNILMLFYYASYQ